MPAPKTSRLAGLLTRPNVVPNDESQAAVDTPAVAPQSAPTPAPALTEAPTAVVEPARPAVQAPYLLRPVAQEAQIQAGLRLRASLKHQLAQYVLDLKQMGYPASEAKVVEVLIMSLDDPEQRRRITRVLTGQDGD